MGETRKRRRLSSSGKPHNEEAQDISPAVQTHDAATDNAVDRSTTTATTTAAGAPRKTLFVRSLPATATNESLTEYFSETHPLKHATVVVDPTTKQCKGYGFVTFADVEEAQQALAELSGSVFEGKKIKIDFAEPRKRDVDEVQGVAVSRTAEERKEKRRQEMQPPKLIVRNIPWSIAEPEQLAVLFRSFGKVKHAAVPKKGSRHAGFGFVVLRGRKNAEKAMEGVNGKEVDGRTLAVDWAVDKSVWENAQTQNEAKATTTESASKVSQDEDEDDEGSSEEEDGGVSLSDDEHDKDEDRSMADADADEDADLQDAEDDEEGEEKEEKEEKEGQAEDDRNASTVFIRNVPFTATDESLYDYFTQFGPVRYARVVYDHETDRPRGTAFVCFWKAEDAMSCVRGAPRPLADQQASSSKSKSATGFKHSVLEDENQDPSGKYTMDGRVLQVSPAVNKKEADRLTAEGTSRRDERNNDKRNLFLLSEGTISSNSPLYSKLSPTEVKMREDSAKQRQKLVKTNPMLHLSLTRLSVRNLPRNITSKALKALAREAVVGFAKDVKNGLREPLSKQELSRSTDAMAEAEKQRKKQGKGIVRQAKVVFEGTDSSKVSEKTGGGRSRGYGFIEYATHRSALMGLRWLNGHAVEPSVSASEETNRAERKKRMIVEFAIENAQVVNRRRENETKWRRKEKQDDDQETQATKDDNNKPKAGGSKQGFKRKRNDGQEDGAAKGSDKNTQSQGSGESGDKDNQAAKKNRIIAKKRMARKTRKSK